LTYALGIDLGTTYTAAALAREGRAEVVALGYRATSVPTVVFLTEEGNFLVGEAAERRAATQPDRVAREFKRRVGDSTPLLLGGSPIAVDRCLAEMLEWVVSTVAETEGEPPAAVTVTHPANWGAFKQDVLREALRLADLPRSRTLAEPIAAATWYAQAQRLAPGQTVAVYDLGGGTFDAAVLRRTDDGRFETLGRTEGIDRLGGIDIDQAVLAHVLRALDHSPPGRDQDPEPESDDPATVIAMAQLREACVEAKEALSSETSVTIPVWLPGLHHQVLLRRTELEERVAPLLAATVDALDRVVTSAGLRPADLHAVLLVGGSSRIPLVARLVSAGLQRPVAVDAHPKHPVALGAAIDAAVHHARSARSAPPASGLAAPAAPAALGTTPTTTPGTPVATWSTPAGSAPSPMAMGSTTGTGTAPAPGAWAPGRPGGPPVYPTAGGLPSNGARGPTPQDRPVGPQPLPSYPPPVLDPAGRGGFRLYYLIAALSPIVVLALVIYTTVNQQNNPPNGSTSNTTLAAPTGQVSTSVAGAGEGSAPASPTGVDLLQTDPAPAFEAFATITYESAVPRVRELVLYTDFASLDVEVPGQPDYVDNYEWRDGPGLSGPEPGMMMDIDAEEFQAHLFDLSEVDPSVIPGLAQDTLSRCTGDGFEITHIIVQRDTTFDDQHRVLVSIYASNPERGGTGGYINYTLDGAFVVSHCD